MQVIVCYVFVYFGALLLEKTRHFMTVNYLFTLLVLHYQRKQS